jgi:hypothetical protein
MFIFRLIIALIMVSSAVSAVVASCQTSCITPSIIITSESECGPKVKHLYPSTPCNVHTAAGRVYKLYLNPENCNLDIIVQPTINKNGDYYTCHYKPTAVAMSFPVVIDDDGTLIQIEQTDQQLNYQFEVDLKANQESGSCQSVSETMFQMDFDVSLL